MTARTATGGPSRDTLRKYIGAFLGSLKDGHADPEDVRAVLAEFIGPGATSSSIRPVFGIAHLLENGEWIVVRGLGPYASAATAGRAVQAMSRDPRFYVPVPLCADTTALPPAQKEDGHAS